MTDQDYNEPYTMLDRLINIILNILTAVVLLAFAGACGYLWVKLV